MKYLTLIVALLISANANAEPNAAHRCTQWIGPDLLEQYNWIQKQKELIDYVETNGIEDSTEAYMIYGAKKEIKDSRIHASNLARDWKQLNCLQFYTRGVPVRIELMLYQVSDLREFRQQQRGQANSFATEPTTQSYGCAEMVLAMVI